MAAHDKLIFALDVPDAQSAQKYIDTLSGHVGWFKVGLELFTACGPTLVQDITNAGIRCFLDLKFHDIPNTAAGAVRSATALGAEMLTVHLSGGRDMLLRARDAAEDEAVRLGVPRVKLVGVSILTSLGDKDITEIGMKTPVIDRVAQLAQLGADCGLDGLVCSPADLPTVRPLLPADFTIITPGIRPAWSVKGDQTRIATPAKAVADGASLLVIGRPIAQADDPAAAADRIAAEIGEA